MCLDCGNTHSETARQDAGVHVAKVDCTTERSICERFSVQSYPTLKVVTGGRSFDYAGSRDQAALAAFAISGHKVGLSSDCDCGGWSKQ